MGPKNSTIRGLPVVGNLEMFAESICTILEHKVIVATALTLSTLPLLLILF